MRVIFRDLIAKLSNLDPRSKRAQPITQNISRTMLGGHSNEDKITKSMEAELKKTFLGMILNSKLEGSMACAKTKIIHSSLFIGSQTSD